jgi:hypothetical protein
VRGLLRRMGADASLADDLAQDAFLTAFQKIGGLQDGAAFAPGSSRSPPACCCGAGARTAGWI